MLVRQFEVLAGPCPPRGRIRQDGLVQVPDGKVGAHARAMALVEMNKRVGRRVTALFAVRVENLPAKRRRPQSLAFERQESQLVCNVERAQHA